MLPATLTGHSWEPGWKVPDQVSGLELGSIAPGIGPVVLLDKIWNLADSKFDNFQPPGPGIPRPWRAGAPWGWQRLARGGRGRGFGRGRWGRPPRSLGRGTRAEHPPAWVAHCWSSFFSDNLCLDSITGLVSFFHASQRHWQWAKNWAEKGTFEILLFWHCNAPI